MPGMSQSRPPMSGFPSMMQPTMLQQQQHQHSQHHSHQEIPDMSDFPALGSANNASSNPGLSSASYASTAGTSNNPNAASSANGMPQEFSIEDDFPALPGARPNSSAGLGNGGRSFNQSLSQQQMQQMHHQQQQHRSQQQQHMMSQDGLSGYSPMSNSTSGAQMQSLQLQQQLANDMMFQQQQSLAQQQQLLQRQLGQASSGQSQLNGKVVKTGFFSWPQLDRLQVEQRILLEDLAHILIIHMFFFASTIEPVGSGSQLGLSPSGSTGEFSKATNVRDLCFVSSQDCIDRY